MNAQVRSESVDVLAVMARLCNLANESGADEGPEGNAPAYRLACEAEEASAAMAELIEAANSHQMVMGHSATLTRLRAALARCGGAK